MERHFDGRSSRSWRGRTSVERSSRADRRHRSHGCSIPPVGDRGNFDGNLRRRRRHCPPEQHLWNGHPRYRPSDRTRSREHRSPEPTGASSIGNAKVGLAENLRTEVIPSKRICFKQGLGSFSRALLGVEPLLPDPAHDFRELLSRGHTGEQRRELILPPADDRGTVLALEGSQRTAGDLVRGFQNE